MNRFYTILKIASHVVEAIFRRENPRIVLRRYIALLTLQDKKFDGPKSEVEDGNKTHRMMIVGMMMAGKGKRNYVRYFFGFSRTALPSQIDSDGDLDWKSCNDAIDTMMHDYLVNFYDAPSRSREFIDILREVHYRSGINPAWSVISKHPDRKFQSLICQIRNRSEKACEPVKTFVTRPLSSD